MKDSKGHGSNARGGQAAAASWRASHQEGILSKVPGLARAFARDERGEGHPIQEAEMALKDREPETTGRLISEGLGTLAGTHTHIAEGAQMLTHLAHFLT